MSSCVHVIVGTYRRNSERIAARKVAQAHVREAKDRICETRLCAALATSSSRVESSRLEFSIRKFRSVLIAREFLQFPPIGENICTEIASSLCSANARGIALANRCSRNRGASTRFWRAVASVHLRELSRFDRRESIIATVVSRDAIGVISRLLNAAGHHRDCYRSWINLL